MKGLLTSIFLTVAAVSALADAPGAHVRFANNDQLHGTLKSLTPEQFVWNSATLEKPTPFFLKDVLEMSLVAEVSANQADHEASVTLTNGDLLRGQLVSIADDAVELKTWYAGRLKLNRLMIADIKISERKNFIYQGPSGLDGWTQSAEEQAWTYQNGGLRSTSAGGISRDVKLPDECSIAFDAAWRGSFGLDLNFFSRPPGKVRAASGYSMSFRQRYISLRSLKNQRSLGNNSGARTLQENEKAHIEVRASLKSGKICVLVDGVLIDAWTDPEVALNPSGRGIQFLSQNPSPMQISRIEVSGWDGDIGQDAVTNNELRPAEIEEASGEEEIQPVAPAPPEPGRIILRNGDTLAGVITATSGEMIQVKTPFREVSLPIKLFRSISLKSAALERCKRENGDLRGWFADGSSVVFRLASFEDGRLTGTSQNFGTATFKFSAFRRLEFNIYSLEMEQVRAASGL